MKPELHKFDGALGALKWLKAQGFENDANLSAPWKAEGRTAYVLDKRRGCEIHVHYDADPKTHAPAVCTKDNPRYSFRNWSSRFTCPTCGTHKRYSLNFLGQRKIVCNGLSFAKVEK